MRHYIAVAIAISIFGVPWLATHYPDTADRIALTIREVGSQFAAVVLSHNPRTILQLQSKYAGELSKNSKNKKAAAAPKVRVMVMPGHEPGYGGAEFAHLKEREMTVELARELGNFLSSNGRYEVIIPRDNTAWSPTFQAYFRDGWQDIIAWQVAHKSQSIQNTAIGVSRPVVPKVQHNSAPSDVAYRLYGLTKWSNENAVDIAIHLHFNDYPGHGRNIAGKYSGFSIYTPEKQYANGTTTRAISEAIFKRLSKYNAVSNFPGEAGGIVDESELIAIGANNTADAASLLIEYGYIYEPQFMNDETRSLALKDLAFQTYLGLEDFFNPRGATVLASAYDTLMLPYRWTGVLSENGVAASAVVASMPTTTTPVTTSITRDIFALQTALLRDGVYPPPARSKNDCPRTGIIGPCTRESVKQFQKKYGLEETGVVGEKTVEQLNKLYSGI